MFLFLLPRHSVPHIEPSLGIFLWCRIVAARAGDIGVCTGGLIGRHQRMMRQLSILLSLQ